MWLTLHTVLLIAALLCFILAAFDVTFKRVNLLALGLAYWVASLVLPLR